MHKGKIFAFVGMAVLGLSVVLFIGQTNAQSTTPFQCGQIRDLVSSNQPWGSGGVYVSVNGTRIGKIYSGVLSHDSYTSSNGVGNSVSPGIIKIGSGNATGSAWDFWIVCGDGQMVQVYMPSISGGYGLCVAADGSTYYIPPTAPYNSEQGSCSSSIFTSANLRRANDGTGTTSQPPPPDLTPPTISTPSATNIAQTSATIIWTTNENADTQVQYDTTTYNFRFATTVDSTMTTSHSVNLTGLTAGTTYNFYAKSKDTAGNLTYYTSAFTTLATPTCTLSLSFANGKTSYVKGESVNYTYTCTPIGTLASNATVQVVKPDGTATTYVTGTNIDTASMGFETTNLTAGTYTLRVCIDPNCAPSATSSMSSLQFTVTEPASTTTAVLTAPTNLTAAYSTENLGQREVVLTVTANATNATYNQLYWRLSGTAWPATAPKDTYSTSSSTWSQPVNVGRIQIFAPTTGGTYEYKLEACNASGCSSSNVASVTVPGTTATSDTPATVVLSALTQYGANKYNIKVEDQNGIKEFSIKKADNSSIYSGLPGAPGNIGACSGTSTFKSVDSGTVTLETSDFPLQASVTDCRTGAAAYMFSVPAPAGITPVSDTPATVVLSALTQYGANKYNIKVEDQNGIKEFSIKKADNSSIYGGSPGASGNTGSCSGTSTFKSVDSGTVTLETSDFPLQASVTDCRTGAAAYMFSVPAPSSVPSSCATGQVWCPATSTTTTGYCATSCNTNQNNWVNHTWTFSDGSTQSSYILNRTDSEYVNYITSIDGKCRAIARPATIAWMSGAGDDSSTNWKNFGIPVCSDSGTGTPPSTPRSCVTGEKCPSGSWCNNGAQCFYPDSQLTCVAWSTATDTWTAPMSSVSCPAGTTACNPTDTNCVEKGQTVPYSSGKWCSSGSQQYYSKDGTKMTCIAMNASTPSGYTSCRPDDTNCIPEESYGPSGGWCSRGMKCNQKVTDTNPKNDVYCTKMMTMGPNPESPSCPAGYGSCSPGETNCKEKGDSWTGTDSSYWCTNAQKCTTATGGTCVGWNESCPAGSKYCSTSDTYCIEPGEYKSLSSGTSGGYWCGGGGGMTFYSSTKAFCEKKAGSGTSMTGMMWTAAEIKTILTKLGAGWGLCRPGDTNCIEPGKTGSSNGWCAWMTPGSYSPMNDNGPRTCPALDGTITAPPVPVTPPPVPGEPTPVPVPVSPGERECGPGEIPGPTNYCMMPMYRWNVTTKTFEKCPAFGGPTATAATSMNSAANQTTSCEPMNYEIEKEWRMEKYTVHPPEKDGQWYMPPWDAATPMLQYDLKTDQLGPCDTRANTAAIAVKQGEMPPYFSPCMPVPEIDKGWMLKKFRAEYRMYKLYAAQNAGVPTPTPVKPGEGPTPILPIEVIKPPVRPVVPAQCKMYLLNVKQGIITDKKFWKDVSRQVKQAPKEYPDLEDVNKILGDSKTILVEIEKLARANKCDTDTLTDLQDKQDTLHSDYFSELSIYLPDMQDFVQYEQCRLGLDNQVKRLQGFLKNDLDDETKASVKELIDATVAKLAEFKNQVTDFEYDVGFECEDYSDELTNQVSPLLMITDKEINRIVEQVVQTKFQPVIAELTARLEEKGQKIEELLVRVAELHKTVEAISQTATKISDSIATSYNALTYIEDKYAEQKTQIEEAKDNLLPVIQKAMEVMKTARCLKGGDKDRMVQEFGELASVNWIGARGDELNKRAQLFISSCEGKDFSKTDVDEFIKNVAEAARQNQQASYQAGLTPFADVPTHEWYFGPMLMASKEGIMTQGRPAENVLKQDALLMLLRATGAPEKEISTEEKCALSVPSVTSVSPYATCAVNYAAKRGVALSGSLTVPVDRAEVVTWLVKLANLPGASEDALRNYTDLTGTTAAEKKAIAAIVESGVMVGNVDGDKAVFNPDSSLVRAELAKIIERLSSRE